MIISFVSPVDNPHSKPQYDLTLTQLTLFFVWFLSSLLWLLRYARITNSRRRHQSTVSVSGGHTDQVQCSSTVSLETVTARAAVAVAKLGGATGPTGGNCIGGSDDHGKWRQLDAAENQDVGYERTVTTAETPRGTRCIHGGDDVNHADTKQRKEFSISSPVQPSPSIDDCLQHIILLGGIIYISTCATAER